MSKTRGVKMIWTEAMDEVLVNTVFYFKAHLPSEVGKHWKTVIDNLFEKEELFIHLKKDHYEAGNYQKFKNRYDKVVKRCNDTMSHGNLSSMPEGGMTEMYRLVNSINIELEDLEDEKARIAEDKKQLDANEVNALNGGHKSKPAYGKDVGGKITGERRPAKQSNIDTAIGKFLNNDDDDVKSVPDEKKTERMMTEWATTNAKDIDIFLEEADLTGEDSIMLRHLGLKLLLNRYCGVYTM